MIVRHPGYAPWSGVLTFHSGQTVDIDFLLEAVAVLEKVDVNATLRDLRLRDFEARRKEGFGRFITGDTFQRNVNREMSAILSGEIAGLRMIGQNNAKIVSTTRDAGPCYVQVIINDMPRYRNAKTDDAFDINSLDPADVLGLEYYTVAATPSRFAGTGGTSGVPEPPSGSAHSLGFRKPSEVLGGAKSVAILFKPGTRYRAMFGDASHSLVPYLDLFRHCRTLFRAPPDRSGIAPRSR